MEARAEALPAPMEAKEKESNKMLNEMVLKISGKRIPLLSIEAYEQDGKTVVLSLESGSSEFVYFEDSEKASEFVRDLDDHLGKNGIVEVKGLQKQEYD